MTLAKSSSSLRPLETLSAASLIFGTLTSILSQQLVYAVAPLPFTFGVHQFLRRRSTSQEVALSQVVQQELSPVLTKLTQLEGELSSLTPLTHLATENSHTLEHLSAQLDAVQTQIPPESSLVAKEELITELQQQLQLRQQDLQYLEGEILPENERLTQEIKQLHSVQSGLEKEKDNFQLQTWELQQQVQELLKFRENSAPVAHPASQTSIDSTTNRLSHLNLAIVGGHANVRQAVIHTLSQDYGLKNYVEIPPLSEQNTNRKRVKDKIGNCDLIVVITQYLSHRLTTIISSLQKAQALDGEVLMLNCRGKSGIIREILAKTN